MQRKFLVAGLVALALSLTVVWAAAGDTSTDAGADPAAGTCLEGTLDCDDTPDEPGLVGDVFDSEAAIAQAKGLLGQADTELEADVRVARRGEEWMMLTEDYRVGRLTVELDINDMDEWIVTAVTVELPDGPQTFTRHLP